MDFTCPACGVEAKHAAWWRVICHACTTRLADTAAELIDLLPDLDDALTRQVVMTTTKSRRRDTTPLPFDPHASTITDAIRDAAAWIEHEARGIAPRRASTPGRIRKIHWHASQYARLRSAPAILAMLTDATHAARHAVDRPTPTRYIGPCYGCGDSIMAPDPLPHAITCRACGETWGAPELLHHNITTAVEARRDELVPLRELAQIATVYTGRAVPYDRIKKWTQRGHVPKQPNGHFRVGDLITHLERTKQ